MSISARRELLFRVVGRYQLGDRKKKTAILDEFTTTTGYARKYAIRRLNQVKNGPPPSVRRSRQRWYGPDVEKARAMKGRLSPFSV